MNIDKSCNLHKSSGSSKKPFNSALEHHDFDKDEKAEIEDHE
jgi:hypothetical protein